MRASGHPRLELYGSATLTILSLTVLVVALPYGLASGIIALSITTFVVQVGFALAARHDLLYRLTHHLIVPATQPITQTAGVPS